MAAPKALIPVVAGHGPPLMLPGGPVQMVARSPQAVAVSPGGAAGSPVFAGGSPQAHSPIAVSAAGAPVAAPYAVGGYVAAPGPAVPMPMAPQPVITAPAPPQAPAAPLEAEVFSVSQQRWNRAQVTGASGGMLELVWTDEFGQALTKQVPETHEHIRWLEVEVFSQTQSTWQRARVVRVSNGVLTICFPAPDGRTLEKVLPLGHPHVRPAGVEDPRPWIEAARAFKMNTDFDVSAVLRRHLAVARFVDITSLFNIMKKESDGKRTIQALADKIILSRMLDNMGMPQMPMTFAARRDVERQDVYRVVEGLEQMERQGHTDAFDVVVKPTHLSNGDGAVIFDKDRWLNELGGWNKEKLFQHMKKYLATKAADNESEALKSLIPGFVVQPRYRSVFDFKTPLEVRVVTLWGKTRLGIWWWGRGIREERRNTWLIRHPRIRGELGPDDTWEILHDHQGHNPGFHEAVKLMQRAMPTMSASAETIATAVGAPFLRSDFFIGSEKWGVRLNEVAYGSGTDYKQRPVGSPCLVDDGPTIARILAEGYEQVPVQNRLGPDAFLRKLGADGVRYSQMVVSPVDAANREVNLPEEATQGFEALAADVPAPMGLDACQTQVISRGPVAWQPGVPTAAAPPPIPTAAVPMAGNALTGAPVMQQIVGQQRGSLQMAAPVMAPLAAGVPYAAAGQRHSVSMRPAVPVRPA
eukprot:TRINITY_DN5755_c0_g1_i1.p1 TRINITY_DN5755_c0_g1~~TRINITY_DN5755_c0_g1_i1.p1  ORF type:complete len:697 (-),score=139.60 TRINITY_DN5755_c0_g1_i1:59-2149(-)